MLIKRIIYCGQSVLAACDGCCHKAWGINSRPKEQLSGDEDDYEFLADDELGLAPEDPGTYEGCDGKPTNPADRMNRWCVRECERHELIDMPARGELAEIELPDYSKRLRNLS